MVGERRAVEKLSQQWSQGLGLRDRRSRDHSQGRGDGCIRL
jgi:hypothetical protein